MAWTSFASACKKLKPTVAFTCIITKPVFAYAKSSFFACSYIKCPSHLSTPYLPFNNQWFWEDTLVKYISFLSISVYLTSVWEPGVLAEPFAVCYFVKLQVGKMYDPKICKVCRLYKTNDVTSWLDRCVRHFNSPAKLSSNHLLNYHLIIRSQTFTKYLQTYHDLLS